MRKSRLWRAERQQNCLLNLGSIAEAQRHASLALEIDPLSLVPRSVARYAAVEKFRPRLAAAIPANFEGFVPVAEAFNRAVVAASAAKFPRSTPPRRRPFHRRHARWARRNFYAVHWDRSWHEHPAVK